MYTDTVVSKLVLRAVPWQHCDSHQVLHDELELELLLFLGQPFK